MGQRHAQPEAVPGEGTSPGVVPCPSDSQTSLPLVGPGITLWLPLVGGYDHAEPIQRPVLTHASPSIMTTKHRAGGDREANTPSGIQILEDSWAPGLHPPLGWA